MKKSLLKIICLFSLIFAALIFSGCTGPTSDSGSSFSSGSGSSGSGSSGSGSGSESGSEDPTDPTTPPSGSVSNPEPSSILLFTSGLLGLAIHARNRAKKRAKK